LITEETVSGGDVLWCITQNAYRARWVHEVQGSIMSFKGEGIGLIVKRRNRLPKNKSPVTNPAPGKKVQIGAIGREIKEVLKRKDKATLSRVI